jgi:hypothetical protein
MGSGTGLDEAVRVLHSEDLEAREGFERDQEEYMEERYPRYGQVPDPSSDGIETESMF